jgi:hypothetical protein
MEKEGYSSVIVYKVNQERMNEWMEYKSPPPGHVLRNLVSPFYLFPNFWHSTSSGFRSRGQQCHHVHTHSASDVLPPPQGSYANNQHRRHHQRTPSKTEKEKARKSAMSFP